MTATGTCKPAVSPTAHDSSRDLVRHRRGPEGRPLWVFAPSSSRPRPRAIEARGTVHEHDEVQEDPPSGIRNKKIWTRGPGLVGRRQNRPRVNARPDIGQYPLDTPEPERPHGPHLMIPLREHAGARHSPQSGLRKERVRGSESAQLHQRRTPPPAHRRPWSGVSSLWCARPRRACPCRMSCRAPRPRPVGGVGVVRCRWKG
jgi:hypothetical protein